MPTEEQIREKLRDVVDPEMGINIIDLGLIYTVTVDDNGAVAIDMTLTSPMCPVGPMIIDNVKKAVHELGPDIIDIRLVWEPAWGPDRLSDEIKLQLGLM